VSSDADLKTLEELPGAVGFPHTVMPTGWFQVGWSHDLKAGDVRPLRYFKQHQVLYRTQDGEAVVLSAFCAHFGAHLGHGGRVDGRNIVCPYHGWVWGTDGRNVLCPAEGGPSSARRRIFRYPVAETNGIVWVWHDALRRDPLWPAPEERRFERNFLPVSEHTSYGWRDVRVQPQFVTENVIDIDHLIYVHRNTLLPAERSEEHFPVAFDDSTPVARVDYASPGTLNWCHGVGVIVTEFPADPERPWRKPAIVYSCPTPLDNERSDIFGTVLVEQDESADGADDRKPVGRALKRVKEQHEQAQADFVIWDHMVYMERPAYSRYEGRLFLRMRRWAQQFYPQTSTGAAAAASSTR
jgi:phenylpropionate dioxygenase-like ring-hydroxylating dioxygenase large terminal subunit